MRGATRGTNTYSRRSRSPRRPWCGCPAVAVAGTTTNGTLSVSGSLRGRTIASSTAFMAAAPSRAGCTAAGASTTRIGSKRRTTGTGGSVAIRSSPQVASTAGSVTGARAPVSVARPSWPRRISTLGTLGSGSGNRGVFRLFTARSRGSEARTCIFTPVVA